jgi:hypothetical protein
MNPSVSVARERLMDWATRGSHMQELKDAKAEFFKATGEVREDEPTFDAWMDAFADWFLCDRPLAGGPPPAQRFLADQGATLPEEDRLSFESFTRTRWSLFLLERLEDGALTVRDLRDAARHRVLERRRVAGVGRGDVMEARLIPRGEDWRFTGQPLFHPPEVRRLVSRVASAARKEGPERFDQAVRSLAVRRLRVDRYRKVDPRKLYEDLVPKRRWLFF